MHQLVIAVNLNLADGGQSLGKGGISRRSRKGKFHRSTCTIFPHSGCYQVIHGIGRSRSAARCRSVETSDFNTHGHRSQILHLAGLHVDPSQIIPVQGRNRPIANPIRQVDVHALDIISRTRFTRESYGFYPACLFLQLHEPAMHGHRVKLPLDIRSQRHQGAVAMRHESRLPCGQVHGIQIRHRVLPDKSEHGLRAVVVSHIDIRHLHIFNIGQHGFRPRGRIETAPSLHIITAYTHARHLAVHDAIHHGRTERSPVMRHFNYPVFIGIFRRERGQAPIRHGIIARQEPAVEPPIPQFRGNRAGSLQRSCHGRIVHPPLAFRFCLLGLHPARPQQNNR